MTVLLLLIGLALVGAAVALGVRAAAMPRLDADKRLGQIRAYGFGEGDARRDAGPGALVRVVEFLGGLVQGKLAGTDEAEVRADLMAAGAYTLSTTVFLGYRVLSSVGLAVLLAFATIAAGSSAFTALMLICIGAAAGWLGPVFLVRRRARARFEQIEYRLPEMVDLLVVTIEAGLGLNSAMQLASSRVPGPLGDELRLALQEQRMGLSTTESLSNMLERCETPSMRSFVRSILQGETLGVSIGTIMRNLGHDMRIRRRQGAEQRAQKAPVKILFPLVFFIFPPMFIVLLFPAVYTFSQTFGKGF
jgi:tight adherence protein C